MIDEMQQEIVNYALIDENSLSTAIKVHAAFEKIKGIIIRSFSDLLLNCLREQLSAESWRIDFDLLDQQLTNNSGMGISNNIWPKGLEIGIEAQNNSGCFVFAAWVPEDLDPNKKDKIKSELNKISDAKQKSGVFWYKNVIEKYKNLNTEAALVDLYKGQKGEALAYFTQELVSIAKAVDSACMDMAQK